MADDETLRTSLPCLSEFKLKPSHLFSLLKNLVGKDLTKVSMPCFINEPFSITQKVSEMAAIVYKGLKDAT